MPPDLIVIEARRAAEEDNKCDRQYRAPRTELQEQEEPLEATGHPPRVRPMGGPDLATLYISLWTILHQHFPSVCS